ncbi:MAG: YeeE/YedE family protein [Burkholderiaceae bacterium]
MDETLLSPAIILLLGLAIGTVFGVVAHKTNFCAMGAVSDIINIQDWERMRMWWLAIGVAVTGVGLLQASGLVDLGASIYLADQVSWLSHIVGGLCFGIGMSLASGCTTKTLIRMGGGNLKSIVVFVVLGVSAYATMKGLFGVWRVTWLDPFRLSFPQGQDLPALFAHHLSIGESLARWLVPLAVGAGLILLAIGRPAAREKDVLVGGVGVGLMVIAAWFVTANIGFVAEHPETLEAAYIGTDLNRPESLSLVAPFANTLELLMLWSDASLHLSFGVMIAAGIVLGSFLFALLTGNLREESFPDAADLKRHLVGAALMGFGGITAPRPARSARACRACRHWPSDRSSQPSRSSPGPQSP